MASKSRPIQILHEAEDKREGMTLAELKLYMADCERYGVPDGQTVKITATWKNSIKEIRAAGELP